MAGRIPDSFLETLNERLNLVDVVSMRMSLKKAGREYVGKCPFHDDSSPSFSVNANKQVYFCFGCGASGGLINFVMEYDRVDFISAIESLASLAGLEIPKSDEDPSAARRRALIELLNCADTLFRQALKSHPDRENAVAYLKDRGLTGLIAHTFGLGFAPDGWRFLCDQLGKDATSRRLLQETGLIITSDHGREYDRFRNRVIFPIRDTRGRTIAFGGRILDEKKPKYLNSPETLLFHKSDTLYGLYEARQANSISDRVLVVEGYMDVVALAQYDIKFAVATLGTALTEQQLDKLSRQTSQAIICFDGDNAGRTAARRALDTMLPFLGDEFSIRFLFLPDGYDPDSLVREEGKDAFVMRLNEALPASEALIQLLSDDVDLTKIDGRARLTALALQKIARVPKNIYRSLMLNTLAEISGTRRQDLDDRLGIIQTDQFATLREKHTAQSKDTTAVQGMYPYPNQNSVSANEAVIPPDKENGVGYLCQSSEFEPTPNTTIILPDPERPEPLCNRILWLLLQNPVPQEELLIVPEGSRIPNIQALKEVMKWIFASEQPTTVALMGHFSGTSTGQLLSKLLKREALASNTSFEAELSDGIRQLKKQLTTESIKQLAKDARSGKISKEDLHQALTEHKK